MFDEDSSRPGRITLRRLLADGSFRPARLVLAGSCVETGIGDQQPRHRLPANDVGLDDLVNVGCGHPAIPNRLRIDDEVRTVLALVQASRLVRADLALETPLGQLLLE